jgi:hypothetical protein
VLAPQFFSVLRGTSGNQLDEADVCAMSGVAGHPVVRSSGLAHVPVGLNSDMRLDTEVRTSNVLEPDSATIR